MIRLYDYLPSGNGYKVRLLLTQLAVPFERIELNIIKGETRTPEFLRKFPNGRIPAVELDDGKLLFESNAIISYFAVGTPFLPADSFQRAQVLQWLFFEQYSHEPYIASVRYLVIHPDVQDPRRPILDTLMRPRGYDALRVMEGHLKSREWFVGERYSVADIALYAYTHVATEGGFDLAGYPAVRAWLERVKSQPRHIPITQG
ncbi:MAG TPA: glutathione S-transferase family protein [Candidatus Binatus sp.]|uniref:glutathione S-transferase family protein n=1 Tax=Candidatus Binatus sp. TaxID=2811406 RepID=UPI002B496469|nr:glutathione S-transferase family protein [Candidatus Binatus sp.]HKN13729.1 glutathione S-transferase family protein [Candidatus Binatus sp.]